jgi:hypothetical protein
MYEYEFQGRSSTIDARLVLIDDVCDRFESSWKILDHGPAAQIPRIEDYLAGWQEPDYSNLLRELISINVAHHQMRGLQVSMEQYEQRFPNHVTIVNHNPAMTVRSLVRSTGVTFLIRGHLR